jgi:two-component system cell cycle sensor histidine kinase/response regulator CckA
MRVQRPSTLAELLRRLAWNGPLLTSSDEREHRSAMARAAVYLYVAGATVGALTLLFPSSGRNQAAVAAASAAAYLLAGLHLAAFDRLPFWAFQASGACASALVTAAAHFGGETGSAYRPLYLCVVFYAVFFYDLRAACVQLALVAAGYAFLVSFPGDHGPAPAAALIAFATVAIAAVIVFVLKRRLRGLVDGLAGSERRYRNLVEQLPLVTYARGLDVLESNSYASPQVEDLLGYPVKEWETQPGLLSRVIHPDERERVIAEFQALRETGEPFSGEYRCVRADGRIVWVQDGTVLVRDEEGRPSHVQGYLLDITQAKAAEAALRMSEQRFRALVADVPGAIFRCENTPDWTMEFVSDAIEEITGYPASDFIANRVRTYGSIIHGDDNADLDPELAAGRPYEVEYRIVHADGSPRWVFERGQGARDEHGNLWLEGVIFDITERKQAEARLAETERRNRALVEQLPLITYIAALDELSSMQYVSPQIEQILGYSVRDWLDDPEMWVRLLHPDDRDRVLELHRTLPIDQEFDCEYRLIAKDGRAVWLRDRSVTIYDDAGNPLHSQGYVVDITEAKRAQEEIVRAKEFSETLIRTANVMVVGLDLDGRVTLFNEAAEHVTGYTFEELRGHPWFELVAGGDRDRADAAETDESPILTKSGEERFVSWRNSEVHENGRITGTISFGIDLTEQKGLEDQLRHSQKMEAVGRLAGGIAHDFNNLLMAISGYSDFALANLEPGGAAAADIEEISKAADRAASLTRQLLAFSRRQVLQPKVLSLNEVIGDLEGMLRRLIGENIRLRVTLDAGLRAVRVDRGQIEQVLMNLTLNARDAMPNGGDLLLTTKNVEVSGARAEATLDLEPGSYTTLVVSDTGHGMDVETRSRAFEPFFTTKKAGEGTGLGLATVYGIVKQSGGSIRLDSVPGKGAVFTLYFPTALQAEQPSTPALAPPDHANGSETILLVEDEDVVRDLVRKMLEQGGYTILEARDGKEALALSKVHVPGIDLLLTDVVMPGMNGRELAERIWFTRPETRVLYMSGYTDLRVFDPEILDPGSAFLHKPFTYAELAGKVREVLDAPRPELAA